MQPLVQTENDCEERKMGKQHKCVFQLITGREASISPRQGASLFLTQAGANSDEKHRTVAAFEEETHRLP